MQFDLNLPGGTYSAQGTAGAFFMILADGGSAIDLKFYKGGTVIEELRGMKRGLKVHAQGGFDNVEIRPDLSAAVSFIISDGAADIDVIGTSTTPMLVSNDRGSPGNLLYVSGVTISDAPATAATAAAPIACGPAAVVVAAANANRRALRFLNLGPDPVAIGPAGMSWAQRTVVLDVGDVMIEDRGANLAWSAITDAGKTASVTRQEVNA